MGLCSGSALKKVRQTIWAKADKNKLRHDSACAFQQENALQTMAELLHLGWNALYSPKQI